jgi:subtilisin family serine protease
MIKKTLLAVAIGATLSTGQAQNLETTQRKTILSQTGVTSAWSRGITGKGALVAVIDDGFDFNHTDIKAAVLSAGVLSSLKTTTYWGSHGTQMASIIAGQADGRGTVGVAPDAKLILLQVGNGGTTGAGITIKGITDALKLADARGAHIVNMSLSSAYSTDFRNRAVSMGGGVYKPYSSGISMNGFSNNELTNYAAANKNSVLVTAAGNQGLAYSAYPAAFATQTDSNGNLLLGGRALIVGSVNSKNQISSFSNRAGHICTKVVGNQCNDTYQVKDYYVVAPGENSAVAIANQLSAGNRAGYASGTSVSSAYVSGGMALIKQAWPQLKANQMVNLVINTATDLGAKGVDEVYGNGLVNFDKATRPQGALVYTTAPLGSGRTAGKVLTTSTALTKSTSTSLKRSSVLQNVQVADEYDRNFTIDLTKSFNSSSPTSSLYGNPYLALTPTNYQEVVTNLDRNTTMVATKTDNGMGFEVKSVKADYTTSLQFGTMSEQSGFLNNYATGLTGFGDTRTTWVGGGVVKPLTEKVSFNANYVLGVTNTSKYDGSIINLSPTIYSDTWKVGLSRSNVFLSDKSSDTVSLSLQGPVAIKKGSATVTAVTGYDYVDDGNGDFIANPISQSDNVNLKATSRQIDLVLGYTASIKTDTQVAVNLTHQMNVGGQAGVTDNVVAIKYVKTF